MPVDALASVVGFGLCIAKRAAERGDTNVLALLGVGAASFAAAAAIDRAQHAYLDAQQRAAEEGGDDANG